MNNKSSTRAILEGAMMTALTVVLVLAGFYIPFMSLLVFITPVPLSMVFLRQGFKAGVITVITSILILLIFLDPISIISMASLFLVGIALGYTIYRKMKTFSIIVVTFFTSLFSMITYFVVMTKILGIKIADTMFKSLEESKNMTLMFYKQLGIKEDSYNQISTMLSSLTETTKILLPLGLIIGSLLIAIVNFYLLSIILKRTGYQKIEPLPSFETWRLPTSISIFFVLVVLLNLFLSKYNIPNMNVILINSFMAFMIAFFVDGMAVIYYFMKKYNWSKVAKTLIIISSLFIPMFTQILAFVGLIDVAIDLRKVFDRK